MREFSVTQCLPNNGQKCLCFGHRTFCCQLDMDKEPNWHEVIFKFEISSYKLKGKVPANPEESILEKYEIIECWDVESDEEPDHVIGVSKWKRIENDTQKM